MISFLELFGGIGLFLFGMNLMGSSLEKLAGSGLEKILQTLTTSKRKGVGALKGWGLGLGVTGIIQSSAATTIMLIGFVNAGIMTLAQTIPVVFGANVGSTVTAQILRLGDLGSGSLVLQLLKPSSFAPMLLFVGAFMFLFSKNQKVKDAAGILIGLGTLFYGMTMMEEVFAPLKESESFQNFFLSFNNPFIGILTGLVLTAIIQSSSASVGILQALSATGSVTYGAAIPIIIGQNIGKCMTIILGGIGANKKAKRVALSYLLFNIIGAIAFSVIIYSIYYTVGIPFFSKAVNRGNIANLHLGFNLIISLVLLPFSNAVAGLTGKLIKENDEQDKFAELSHLDEMLLKTPGIALSQCKNVMKVMSEKIDQNYSIAVGLIENYDSNAFNTLSDNEDFIDKCETVMTAYIVKIDRSRLTPDNRRMIIAMLNSIGDYERIGDYCINIAYTARGCNENKLVFSEKGMAEIKTVSEAVRHILELTFSSADEEAINKAYRVLPLYGTIEKLNTLIESHHVDRLQEHECGVQGGVALYDLINSFQGIALHSKTIAKHVIKRLSDEENIDERHGVITDKESEEYIALEKYYYSKYIENITPASKTEEPEKIIEKAEKKSSEKHDKKSSGKSEKHESVKSEKRESVKSEKKESVKSDKKEKNKKGKDE